MNVHELVIFKITDVAVKSSSHMFHKLKGFGLQVENSFDNFVQVRIFGFLILLPYFVDMFLGSVEFFQYVPRIYGHEGKSYSRVQLAQFGLYFGVISLNIRSNCFVLRIVHFELVIIGTTRQPHSWANVKRFGSRTQVTSQKITLYYFTLAK